MTRNWRVHKVTNLRTPRPWVVHEPDGSWSAAFATWGEAMRWANNAADLVTGLEDWLKRAGWRHT